jgi:hypothetical protein
MNIILQFLRDMFSNDSPISFGRCASGLFLVFIVGWDTASLIWHHTPVSGAELLAQAAAGSAWFLISKVNETVQKKGGTP